MSHLLLHGTSAMALPTFALLSGDVVAFAGWAFLVALVLTGILLIALLIAKRIVLWDGHHGPTVIQLAAALAATSSGLGYLYAVVRNSLEPVLGSSSSIAFAYWFLLGLGSSLIVLILFGVPFWMVRRGVTPGQAIGMSALTAAVLAAIVVGAWAALSPRGFVENINSTYEYQTRRIKRELSERYRIKGEQLQEILDEYSFLQSDEIPYVQVWHGSAGEKYHGSFPALLEHGGDEADIPESTLNHAEELAARMEERGFTVTISRAGLLAHRCPLNGPHGTMPLFKLEADSESAQIKCVQDHQVLYGNSMQCAIYYKLAIR